MGGGFCGLVGVVWGLGEGWGWGGGVEREREGDVIRNDGVNRQPHGTQKRRRILRAKDEQGAHGIETNNAASQVGKYSPGLAILKLCGGRQTAGDEWRRWTTNDRASVWCEERFGRKRKTKNVGKNFKIKTIFIFFEFENFKI